MDSFYSPDLIRPFEAHDYEPMVALWNRLYPDAPRTVVEIRDTDQQRQLPHLCWRLVAQQQGELIGVAQAAHNPGTFHPQRFYLELYVDPGFRGKGVGQALWQQLEASLQPYQPRWLMVSLRAEDPAGLAMAQSRGFVEEKRDWVSRLDLSSVDLTPWASLEDTLRQQGIELVTFADLLDHDPQAAHKLHALFSEVRLDVPRSAPPTPLSFEFFVQNLLRGPDYDPQGFFVAIKQGEWLGYTAIYRVGETGDAEQWLTGVRRPFRGMRIATALKVKVTQFAREQGYRMLHTDNDSRNAPMLAINRKLGFVPGSVLITLCRTLPETDI